MISDTGIPSKDPGHQYDFAQSARAHSVLTADGLDFPRDADSAYGSGILASGEGDGWFAIEAANPLLGQIGVEHRRTLLYKPGYALAGRRPGALRQPATPTAATCTSARAGASPPKADRLLLRDEGKEISVFSSSTDPNELRQLVRGRTDPFQGFVFTDFRQRDARYTTWFSNETADLDGVITVALKKRREARATALDPLGDASDAFEISPERRTQPPPDPDPPRPRQAQDHPGRRSPTPSSPDGAGDRRPRQGRAGGAQRAAPRTRQAASSDRRPLTRLRASQSRKRPGGHSSAMPAGR